MRKLTVNCIHNQATRLIICIPILLTTHGVTTSRIAKENYMDLKGDDVKKIMKEKKKKK